MANIFTLGSGSELFISQIAAQGDTYDIATAHTIKFKNGSTDPSGVEWNGVAPLEVVIPSVTDIITDPVRFVGTVGSDGIPKNSQNETITPTANDKGWLVYITANCEFPAAGNYCEAGDMAVWDGSSWHVIAGENQVSLEGTNIALTGASQSVITVEGQTLTLAIDYSDVRSHTSILTNASTPYSVTGATVNVASKYVGISKVEKAGVDITDSVTISLPKSLASGAVTINENVLEASNISLQGGSFPSLSKNTDTITVSASTDITIGQALANDAAAASQGYYVTDVTAIKAATLVEGGNGDPAYVTGLTAISGTNFVTGAHSWTSEDAETPADFTVYGAVSTSDSFATGWGAEAASGEVVSSVTINGVDFDASSVVTGLSGTGSTVITGVTFGSVEKVTGDWFVTGLTEGSDVVTGVDFGSVTLVSDSTSQLVNDAITAASVVNHVLTFNTGSFMIPVAVSVTGQDVSKAGFATSSVSLSGFSSTSDTLTSAAVSDATVSLSYKSLVSSAVSLSQDSVKWYFNKAQDHAYQAEVAHLAISTTNADVAWNAPTLENTGITAAIDSGLVVVGASEGSFPTISVAAATGTLTGSVSTALSTEDVTWLAVASDKKDIAVPDWTLVEDSTVAGAIAVASASSYAVNNGIVTIPAGNYVVGVKVDGTEVNVDA